MMPMLTSTSTVTVQVLWVSLPCCWGAADPVVGLQRVSCFLQEGQLQLHSQLQYPHHRAQRR